jgi:hypothetical protein
MVYLDTDLKKVLAEVVAFLNYFSQETVFMRIKEEYSASENTTSFAEKVESHLSRYNNIYRGSGGF